ncbi:MAG: hypothetical protein DMG13_21325 [Acidobacteria bacterium]|nr:MAG: hypothetical protein DMG13_21325 [Acidobacteriota bacterium]
MKSTKSFGSFGFLIGLLIFVVPAVGVFTVVAKEARLQQELRRGESAKASPVVQTDKESYLAGEIITISGSGFAPLESVMLRVKHAGGTVEGGMGHEPWWVYADADGAINATWALDAHDTAGVNLAVEAASSSGSSAQAAFVRRATISTDRFSYRRGDTARIRADGFSPKELVTIQVNDGQHKSMTITSDENGRATVDFTIADEPSATSFAITAAAPESGLLSLATVVVGGGSWFIVTDQQGADDVNSEQVDMNLMGRLDDSAAVKKYVAAWDATASWTGTGQTGDICILFDTNNNTMVDFAICTRVANFNANPAVVRVVPQATNKPVYLFSCTDARNDRCSQPTPVPYAVNDVVTSAFGHISGDTLSASTTITDNLILESDPFTNCAKNQFSPCVSTALAASALHPETKDTVVEVHLRASKLPAGSSLVNVCTYPSAGNGGNNNPFDCIVTPGAGFLKIKKDAGGDTTPFHFTVGPPAPFAPQDANYTVSDGTPSPDIGVQVTTNLTVTENSIPSGWSLTGAICTLEGGASDTVAFDSANQRITGVEIQSGKITTCTFTNGVISPKLTVTKVVHNNNGGLKEVANFPLFVDSTSVTSGVQNSFSAGPHNVSETNLDGYAGVITGDCAGDGSITLALGDAKSCTITNTDQPGTLIVKKLVINDNGLVKHATDFSFQVGGGAATAFLQDGADVLKGKNTLNLDAGTYTITEPAVAGYATTYDKCTNVVVANGGTQTCTITNDDEPKQPSGLSNQSWVLQDNVTFDIRPNGPDGTSETHKVTFSLYTGCNGANGNGTPVCTPEAVDINKATGYASTVNGCLVGPTGGDTTYYWIASYEGDQYNKPAATACGEEVTQIKAKDNGHITLP